MSNKYIGNELELFINATHWKNYYGSFIKPLLKGKIAEVGAGIGGTTATLCDGTQQQWLCIEPDPELVAIMDDKIKEKKLPSVCTTYCGILQDLKDSSETYDNILYIDVIEHIADDAAELKNAYAALNQGGRLIVIVPAHNSLFSPFDKQIGHYRRYNKKMLKSATPANMKIEKLYYLDSIGYFASLFNKYFLKQKMPNRNQINFWDKNIVPISTFIDKLLQFNFGKSVLLIAKKETF